MRQGVYTVVFVQLSNIILTTFAKAMHSELSLPYVQNHEIKLNFLPTPNVKFLRMREICFPIRLYFKICQNLIRHFSVQKNTVTINI